MSARTSMTIELSRHQLRAAAGVRDADGVRIERVLSLAIPDDVGVDEPASRGKWIRDELARAGFTANSAVIALGRDDVMLKRLTLPTRVDDELPEMVRLALGREMLVDPADAVIDYVVTDQGATSSTVTAVAAPNAVLDRTAATLDAAGLSADRITLRVMGVVELVRTLGTPDGCVLAIDVTTGGVEYSVVERGVVRFSRAAELPVDETPAILAERLVTETRRTWMSYRIVESVSTLDRVVLFGEPGVAEPAAAVIGEMLGVPGLAVTTHPRVQDDSGRVTRAWPLAGLLLAGEATPLIDFRSPERGTGRAATRRRRAVMAAGLAAVVLLAGWTLARTQRKGLERKLDGLESRITALRPAHDRYLRDTFTVAHLKRLDDANVGWLDHLVAIKGLLPPRDQAVLDSWQGSLEFRGVRYDHTEKAWSTPRVLTMVVEGEAVDRQMADAVRAALVAEPAYDVTSTGADTRGGQRYPYGFRYRITTTKPTPRLETDP